MNPAHSVPADPQPDWAHLLPRDAFHEIMLILRGALPPPATDDPGDRPRRDRAAIAGVASLLPVTAAEGRLAAQFVAADAWAMDCLRLAAERRLEPEIARKCRAQAMSLMREAKSSLRMLLRLQAMRGTIEQDAAASDRAAWAEHGAAAMMAKALSPAPAAPRDDKPPAEAEGDGGQRRGPALRPVSCHATGFDDRRVETQPRPDHDPLGSDGKAPFGAEERRNAPGHPALSMPRPAALPGRTTAGSTPAQAPRNR